MRKFLLLTAIGGLGFSPQIFSALNSISHTMGIDYLHSKTRVACVLPYARIMSDHNVLFLKLGQLYIWPAVLAEGIEGSRFPATGVSHDQGLLSLTNLNSGNSPICIPVRIPTVATVDFNRMVNRKRILLSG